MPNEPSTDDRRCNTWFYNQYKQLDERGREVSQNIRAEAVKLHKENEKWIYGLYGVLDGLSCSFTMLRFYFDARFANSSSSSSDMLHDWLITPEGFACLLLESTVVIGLSFVGNTYDKKNPQWTDKAAVYWSPVRDGMKALKNGYRGVRNAMAFSDMIALTHHLRYWAMPAGIILGAISMLNRPWLTRMRKERDNACTENMKEMKDVEQLKQQTDGEEILAKLRVDIDDYLKKQNESQPLWFLAYLSASYNGLLDAPNLYFGAVTLTVLAPAPWILFMVAIFAIACIATRIYEEYNGQNLLLKTQIELKLVCAENEESRDKYQQELDALSTSFKRSRVLVALTNGVDAYAAISSAMFAVATICLLASIPFPPLLLAVWIAAGALCMVVPVLYYLVYPDPKPIFVKEWFEICRSFFAGGNKGLRSMDFILPSWEEADGKGHYHDTSSMMPFTWILAALYAASFSLRNVARLEKTTKNDNSGSAMPFAWIGVALYDTVNFPFRDIEPCLFPMPEDKCSKLENITAKGQNPVTGSLEQHGIFPPESQPAPPEAHKVVPSQKFS